MDKLFFGEVEKEGKEAEAKYMAARGARLKTKMDADTDFSDLVKYNSVQSEEE